MTVEALINEFTKLNRQEKKHFLDEVLNSFLERSEKPLDSISLTKEQDIDSGGY